MRPRVIDPARVPSTLKLCLNAVLLTRNVPENLEYIRFAANLAIFDVTLPAACRLIHHGLIPLSTASALEPGSERHAPPCIGTSTLSLSDCGGFGFVRVQLSHLNQCGIEGCARSNICQALRCQGIYIAPIGAEFVPVKVRGNHTLANTVC